MIYYLLFFLIIFIYICYRYFTTNTIYTFYGKIATNDTELQDGLMHRKDKLGDNQGMLFPMDKGINSMWMKNTYIPLDIIFMDSKKRIVGYIEDAVPLSEKSLSIDRESSFVLEVDGNTISNKNITIGDIILFKEVVIE